MGCVFVPNETLIIVSRSRVQRLAKEIGDELWNVGELITKRSEVQEVNDEKVFFPEHALLFIALVPVRKGFDDVTLVSGREDAMNE